MDFGLPIVVAILAIAYFAGDIVKKSKLDDKWIPDVCGAVGAILGAVGFMIHMPDFPANDIITAIAIGLVSGFAATGINQAVKQLNK